jgi:hypothetical protein
MKNIYVGKQVPEVTSTNQHRLSVNEKPVMINLVFYVLHPIHTYKQVRHQTPSYMLWLLSVTILRDCQYFYTKLLQLTTYITVSRNNVIIN